MRSMKYARRAGLIVGCAVTAVALLGASGCDDGTTDPQRKLRKEIDRQGQARRPYLPKNDVEFNNFDKAQRLYDSPTTVIWCTTTWANPSAPIVTIPIAGKLTSSSVSYLPQQRFIESGDGSDFLADAPSSDGMFHGNPAPYRYGFTPGGQYNDFFNMPTLCTTSLTKFQRKQTFVSTQLDSQAASIDQRAQAALRQKDPKKAQEILNELESNG